MDPFLELNLPRSFDLSREVLEKRYRELQKVLHPDRFARASSQEKRLSLSKAVSVNEAYRILKDDLARAEALFSLEGGALDEGKGEAPDPDFLMEVMELREALHQAKKDGNHSEVENLKKRVERKRDYEFNSFANQLKELSQESNQRQSELQRLSKNLSKLKYYKRFLDEVSAIEEDVL